MIDRWRGLVARLENRPLVERAALACAWAAGIWVLSSRPSLGAPAGVVVVFVFNGGHFVLFGVLGALAALALGPRSRARRVVAVGLAAAWGVLDELHQRSVPGRDVSVLDAVTDASGAWFAVAALSFLCSASVGARRAMFAAAALGLGAVAAGTFL